MDRETYYHKLFIIAALWNIVISISLLTLLALQLDVWDLMGIIRPNSFIWLQEFLLLVGVFGIGYYAISKNLKDNHVTVLMGIVGKSGVFSLNLYYFLIQEVGISVMLLGCGDLIFAILFIEFLLSQHKKK